MIPICHLQQQKQDLKEVTYEKKSYKKILIFSISLVIVKLR